MRPKELLQIQIGKWDSCGVSVVGMADLAEVIPPCGDFRVIPGLSALELLEALGKPPREPQRVRRLVNEGPAVPAQRPYLLIDPEIGRLDELPAEAKVRVTKAGGVLGWTVEGIAEAFLNAKRIPGHEVYCPGSKNGYTNPWISRDLGVAFWGGNEVPEGGAALSAARRIVLA